MSQPQPSTMSYSLRALSTNVQTTKRETTHSCRWPCSARNVVGKLNIVLIRHNQSIRIGLQNAVRQQQSNNHFDQGQRQL
jgi:hypothetical protein